MRNTIEKFVKLLYLGWKDSGVIINKTNNNKGRINIYKDIVWCFLKYKTSSTQYIDNSLFDLPASEKEDVLKKLLEQNKKRAQWEDLYLQNWKFLNKWSKLKWETSIIKRALRTKAYTKHYGFGNNCYVQYDVIIICEHFHIGALHVDDNVLFARGCDIDYTGDLSIGKNVMLSESVKILTHDHSLLLGHDTIITPLVVHEEVRFGARVLVLPGVNEIGRGSMIAAGAVVKHPVPPYSIVMGNPAKIVGFRFTPEQIIEYEEDRYPLEERYSKEYLDKNYKKYYLDRINEISNYLQ